MVSLLVDHTRGIGGIDRHETRGQWESFIWCDALFPEDGRTVLGMLGRINSRFTFRSERACKDGGGK